MSDKQKYRALIIDDERSSRLVLKKLLEQDCSEIDVLGELGDIEEGYHAIKELKPDLVFLDIRMPKGDSFTLLERLGETNFEVIFVTSYDQYALSAIKASALDYLLKPVERKELVAAVAKFKKRFLEKTPTNSELIRNLFMQKERKVAIHHKGNVMLLPIEEINFIEADINYSNVYTHYQNYYVAKTLAEWEEILQEDKLFIRVNKSTIINCNYCSYYEKGNPVVLVLKNNNKVPVSRRRRSDVLERIKG